MAETEHRAEAAGRAEKQARPVGAAERLPEVEVAAEGRAEKQLRLVAAVGRQQPRRPQLQAVPQPVRLQETERVDPEARPRPQPRRELLARPRPAPVLRRMPKPPRKR